MAQSAGSIPRRYTYTDLEAFPNDNIRREVIDGQLFVNPSPFTRHQRAVGRIFRYLDQYADKVGGEAFTGPIDMFINEENVVAPDVVFMRADHLSRVGEKNMTAAPDLVVEISSPSTRQRDRTIKKDLYARFGVEEFWFVDLNKECVEVYCLSDGAYGPPTISHPGDSLKPTGLPGLTVPVTQTLAAERS